MLIRTGQTFTRLAIAKACAPNAREALNYACQRWGNSAIAAGVLRSAVAGLEESDFAPMADAGREILEIVSPLTVLGRLQGVRRVPSQTPVATFAESAVGYWVGGGKAVPVSRAALDSVTRLAALKCAALIVLSNELAQNQSIEAEALIQRDLIRALVKLTDQTFIGGGAGSAGVSPASITNGVTPIASSGDLAEDLAAALEAMTDMDLSSCAWAMSPSLAARIALRAGGVGLAADLGIRGGTLLGLPVYVSQGLALDSNGASDLVLIDASALIVVDEGVEVRGSSEAMVEMSDAPTGATITPTGASASRVSLFQSDATGILATRHINWLAARPPVVIGGALYAAS